MQLLYITKQPKFVFISRPEQYVASAYIMSVCTYRVIDIVPRKMVLHKIPRHKQLWHAFIKSLSATPDEEGLKMSNVDYSSYSILLCFSFGQLGLLQKPNEELCLAITCPIAGNTHCHESYVMRRRSMVLSCCCQPEPNQWYAYKSFSGWMLWLIESISQKYLHATRTVFRSTL